MFSDFVERPLWEMPDGSFVVMNAEFALARRNTRSDAYRNVFMALCPDLFKARTESDYCDACGQLRTTLNCEYCVECPCNQPNPDDAGNCQKCGEVGIVEV